MLSCMKTQLKIILTCLPVFASAARAEMTGIPHEVRRVEGWKVHVDKSLLAGEHADLGKTALRVLTYKLYRLTLVMPADKLRRLREVPIYLDRKHPLGPMQYHPSPRWLREHGYDPAMARAVHIPRAAGLVNHARRQDQPWVILHELAHAYHDRVLGFGDERVVNAYERAKSAGLYQKVRHIRGHTGRHYALTNHKEFFAEMTEAYFGCNDFFPFVRGELKHTDPATFDMLSGVWGRR